MNTVTLTTPLADDPRDSFSQLGLGEGHAGVDEAFIKHSYFDDPAQVVSVHCGRWSTIAVVKDA